ncbi:Josephin-1 [Chionoecetes opilio]|uniref:Josephin-2 n=1 Tax=Chionoecetes opilio TaxID=41210 RepID=A0A8J4YFL8_CHIOP|nr:Josephin-1 [Chionoecetes opilio]
MRRMKGWRVWWPCRNKLPCLLSGEHCQVGVAMTPDIYHEKQIKELCALHSLNNLFQDGAAFAKSELDNICYALSPDNWFNPHKSLLGTGNYDINVIMAALVTKGCGVVWFDKRKDPQVLVPGQAVGFILNVPSQYRLGPVQLPLRRKHWVAIRSIRGIYYNLDSKLDTPEIIGQAGELIQYLREELRHKEKELFVVVTEEVERLRAWCSSPPLHPDAATTAEGEEFLATMTSTNCLVNGKELPPGAAAFNPPGLSFIDQESAGPDSWSVGQAMKASQETL